MANIANSTSYHKVFAAERQMDKRKIVFMESHWRKVSPFKGGRGHHAEPDKYKCAATCAPGWVRTAHRGPNVTF